jgi:glycosyltransferase involved in cell wall biosynthesis
VYDAHEYVRGTAAVAARRVAAYADLESEFIADADRVITVSEPLAAWLRRDHGLSRLPDVVLNAPVDVPVLVYGGGVNRDRGVETIVWAVPLLPSVHLVVVARGNTVVVDLQRLARTLGVGDRMHVVPDVDADLVPAYLASATVGVSSLLRAPNHDIAVTNKFCEYLAAGLPIVTSDTPAQAVRDVLRSADLLRERIAGDPGPRSRFSWAGQAEVVRAVYDELLAGLPDAAWQERALHLSGSLDAR